jgi:hypothetical protein
LVALAAREMGAGEKLTSPEDEVEFKAELVAPLWAGALVATGAAIGLGAGLGAGFATGFCSATGTPFLIGVKRDPLWVGVGFGAGFGAAGAAGAFEAGTLAAGVFGAATTVRVAVTDLAQTVTEVGPVFDECENPPDDEAEQAQAGNGESW